MNKIFDNITTIAFDADDTLWENENFFRDAEKEFYVLMQEYATKENLEKELYKREIAHLPLYGYGIKSFILSMIETALVESKNTIKPDIISEIINIGKKMLAHPVLLLDDVEPFLTYLKSKNYRLILATKGDLVDQERKLEQSGLKHYFHHIEIMTDKQSSNYTALLQKLDIEPSEFLMIGNSIKSDIIPVINIGGKAIYIPFHTTWVHEEADAKSLQKINYLELSRLGELIE